MSKKRKKKPFINPVFHRLADRLRPLRAALSWINWAWINRASTWLSFPILAMYIVYMVFAVRYNSFKPTYTHNWAAELLDEIESVPEEQQAWTHYRRALMQLESLRPIWQGLGSEDDETSIAYAPGEPFWELTREYLVRNRSGLKLVRSAATISEGRTIFAGRTQEREKRMLIRHGMSPEFWVPTMAKDEESVYAVQNDDRDYLVRDVFRLLGADCLLAIEEADYHRAMANVIAQVNIARQMAQGDNQAPVQRAKRHLVSAIRNWEILRDDADKLDSTEFLQFQQSLEDFKRAPNMAARLKWEERLFRDFLQENYSNDGNGDGEFCGDLRLLKDTLPGEWIPRRPTFLEELCAPFTSLSLASRKETVDKFLETKELLNEIYSRPYWEQENISLKDRLAEWKVRKRQHPLIFFHFIHLNNFTSNYFYWQHMIQECDAAIVSVALVRYQKEHGRFPEKLAALVPDFLAEIPPDRIDGEPLRYRLNNDGPVLYSLGRDHDDDGGRAAKKWKDAYTVTLSGFYDEPADADWILWPLVEYVE